MGETMEEGKWKMEEEGEGRSQETEYRR